MKLKKDAKIKQHSTSFQFLLIFLAAAIFVVSGSINVSHAQEQIEKVEQVQKEDGKKSERDNPRNKSNASAIEMIKKVMQSQADGWNEGNIDKYMVGYWNSEKLTFSAGGSTTRGYQATLDRYKKKYDSPEKMGKLNFSDQEITMLGRRAALVIGRWKLTLKGGDAEGNYSVVFKKIKEDWVVIHDHSSSLEQEEE